MILNFRNMKRIIYSAAIAALLVTSCQKTDVLNVVEEAIEFGTEVGKLTKADDESTTPNYDVDDPKYGTLVQQGFRVWAVADFESGNAYEDGYFYDGINGVDVAYTTGWGFPNGEKHMWPAADDYLYFYMISSRNITWLESIKSEEKFGKGEASATDISTVTLPIYTIAPDTDTKVKVGATDVPAVVVADNDIMVADHIRQDKGAPGTDKTVRPHFRHTMTKVQFNFVKGEQVVDGAPLASNVILKSITTSPLNNAGVLTVNYSTYDEITNTKSDAQIPFEWTNKNGQVPFTKSSANVVTYVVKGGAIVTAAASYEDLPSENVADGALRVVYATNGTATVYKATVTEGDGGNTVNWVEDQTANAYKTVNGDILTTTQNTFVTWYMIPQNLTPATFVDGEVTEEGTIVTIEYVADGKDITQKFSLAVDGPTEDWTKETCVRYNVTIAPNKIVFSPDVTDWDTTTNNKPGMSN